MRPLPTAVLLTAVWSCQPAWSDRDKDSQKKIEARQERKLTGLAKKLQQQQAVPNPAEINVFLHTRAATLLEKTRQSRSDAYLFERLSEAAEDLLEASENIFDSAARVPEGDQREKAETARRLERCYFRVQQADYFARLSGDPEAGAYTRHARSLYQQARSAYDAGHFKKAGRLGEAARDIVSALENLAQASVRVPEPPRLP